MLRRYPPRRIRQRTRLHDVGQPRQGACQALQGFVRGTHPLVRLYAQFNRVRKRHVQGAATALLGQPLCGIVDDA